MRLLRIEHLVTATVAAAIVILALAEGGFEPTAYAATALIVWSAVVVGLAIGALPRSEPPPAAIACGLCVAGFVALTALSLTWASDNGRAFEDVVRALAYLGVFVGVVLGSRRDGAAEWLRGIAIGLVAVGAIALLARFEPGPFGDPDADLREALPAAGGRLTYPIGYWNGLAAAMAAAVVLLAWFGVAAATRRGRALSVAALPLVVLALWATDSRGGFVAAGLAFVVLVAVGPHRARLTASLAFGSVAGAVLIAFAAARDQLFELPGTAPAVAEGDGMLAWTLVVVIACGLARYALDRPLGRLTVSPRVGWMAVGTVAALVIAGFVAADPVQVYENFKAPPAADEIDSGRPDLLRTGGSGRYQFWGTAVDAFGEAPVAGLGSGDYGPYWLEHREQPLVATRAHSLLFETAAELGAAGLALIVGFFAVAAATGLRRRRQLDRVADLSPALAVLAVGFSAAAVDWTWDLAAVFVPTVIVAGLLTGPATLASADIPSAVLGTARSRRRFAGGVALLLVAWLSICAAGLLLLSDHSLESSRDRATRGDLAGAIEAADSAADVEPWASEPRTQLALLYESGGDIPAALEALAEAIERSPRDYRLYLLEARLLLAEGDRSAARASLATAHRLNPLEPVVREQIRSFHRL